MAYRKLHIGKDVWEYSTGSGVKIRSPNGEVAWTPLYAVLGMTREQYEHEIWQRGEDSDGEFRGFAVAPSHIKKYIEKNLL